MEEKRIDIEFNVVLERCPICGNDALHQYALASNENGMLPAVPKVADPINYDQCKGCSHIFQNPTYSQVTEDGIYSGLYREVCYPNGANLFEYNKEQMRTKGVASVIMTFRHNKFFYINKHLDVGSGMGSLSVELIMLSGGAFETYPCDRDADSLEFYRKSGLPAFTSIEEASREKGPFDFVSAVHLFEHFTNPREQLIKIGKIMPQSGTLLIICPSPFANDQGSFGLWHPQLYTEESVRTLARTGAFEVFKQGYFGPKEKGGNQWVLLRRL